MKRFILEQSDDEFYRSHSGLVLAGLCLNSYSNLPRVLGRKMKDSSNLISDIDLLRSYIGLLCLGKSDYEAVTGMKDDDYFKNALGITNVPSAERLRQRLDKEAENYLPIVQKCSVAMLKNGKAHLTALDTGHIPLDVDVFPMDKSSTKKEKVSRTYKGHDDYAPIAAYLGLKGWCLEVELRPGSQHSQEGFIPFIKRILAESRTLTQNKLLVHLDSAHDAIETRVLLGNGKLRQGLIYLQMESQVGRHQRNNILRFIGQLGLLGERSPVRHPAKRRRIKTVIQKLMCLAARLIRSGNRLRLRFSRHYPAYQAFEDV